MENSFTKHGIEFTININLEDKNALALFQMKHNDQIQSDQSFLKLCIECWNANFADCKAWNKNHVELVALAKACCFEDFDIKNLNIVS